MSFLLDSSSYAVRSTQSQQWEGSLTLSQSQKSVTQFEFDANKTTTRRQISKHEAFINIKYLETHKSNMKWAHILQIKDRNWYCPDIGQLL